MALNKWSPDSHSLGDMRSTTALLMGVGAAVAVLFVLGPAGLLMAGVAVVVGMVIGAVLPDLFVGAVNLVISIFNGAAHLADAVSDVLKGTKPLNQLPTHHETENPEPQMPAQPVQKEVKEGTDSEVSAIQPDEETAKEAEGSTEQLEQPAP